MTDVIYVLATIVFIALMLLYVVACERLGHSVTAQAEQAEESRQ